MLRWSDRIQHGLVRPVKLSGKEFTELWINIPAAKPPPQTTPSPARQCGPRRTCASPRAAAGPVGAAAAPRAASPRGCLPAAPQCTRPSPAPPAAGQRTRPSARAETRPAARARCHAAAPASSPCAPAPARSAPAWPAARQTCDVTAQAEGAVSGQSVNGRRERSLQSYQGQDNDNFLFECIETPKISTPMEKNKNKSVL